MIEINADLHFHSTYSGATSRNMLPDIIAAQAPRKGLQLVGSADALHSAWLGMLKSKLKISDGLLEHPNGTKFVLQTEVEDLHRVHHIILFPDFSKLSEVRQALARYCKNLDADGRPKLALGAQQLAEICADSGCLIGFAHAFTPYFGLYSKFDSYKQCYGSRWRDIHFLELGLSADTDMADRIAELQHITFTSNSDCHSPWPNKLGREFTRFRLAELTFDELARAIRRERGRGPVLNVKFDPREGKYNKSRCRSCLLFFRLADAQRFGWRCPACGGPIKKGVADRIEELASWPEPRHPPHRPSCIHIIPLAEIIALALKKRNVWSEAVQELWKEFVTRFGNEISVLIDTPLAELESVHKRTAELIAAFRSGSFQWIPGGAGVYGVPVPPGKEPKVKYFEATQKSLGEFIYQQQ